MSTEKNNNKLPNSKINIVGIILIGGKSSRMGKDKAKLTFKNQTFENIAYDVLMKSGIDKVYLVGKDDLTDLKPNLGPLSGLFTISKVLPENQTAVVIPVDMPNLKPKIITYLIEQSFKQNSKLTIYANHIFPFVITFTKNINTLLEDMIINHQNHSLALKDFFRNNKAEKIVLPFDKDIKKLLSNINSKQDYQDLLNE